jgi:Protein of unknown function (DUF2442)
MGAGKGWTVARSDTTRVALCSIRCMAADERYWDAEVTSVAVTGHWRLRLEFADGYSGEVDVSHLRRKAGLFKDLRDPEYFARAFLDEEQGTVAWPNGMDVAAHVLRARADQQARPRTDRQARRRGLSEQEMRLSEEERRAVNAFVEIMRAGRRSDDQAAAG